MKTTLTLTIKAATTHYLVAEAHRLAAAFFGEGNYEIAGAYSTGVIDSLEQHTFDVYVERKD